MALLQASNKDILNYKWKENEIGLQGLHYSVMFTLASADLLENRK